MQASALLILGALVSAHLGAEEPGTTRIARWHGDRAAAFVLMFDDTTPSQAANVVPALKQRGLTGTFYINPGAGHYAAARSVWEKDLVELGMELANHTMTHKGVRSVEEAEREIGGCNAVIRRLTPRLPWPRLVSWGQPGVAKEAWTIAAPDLAAQLAANHLVPRPEFGGRGAMVALKTADEMMAHVEKAIAAGGMECIIYHGVGGDWLATPLPVFIAFLDRLAGRRDAVWITGHIAAHQYARERDAATVTVTDRGPSRIGVTLGCTADAALYDHPLTLVTAVPAAWTRCAVDQGTRHVEVTVDGGSASYDALPGGGPIVLTPAR